MKYFLAYNRCPLHGFESISLDNDDGGTRLTRGKCCGRWDVVIKFPMSTRSLNDAITVFENAINDLVAEEKVK
jgi:hypothetical protein